MSDVVDIDIDMEKVESLVHSMVGYMTGAAVSAGVVLGDQLGFYRTLAGASPMTADAVADKTGCNPRLTREWLDGQSAGGLVTYDAAADNYSLSNEAALVLANEDSPAFLAGGVSMFQAMFDAIPKLVNAFQGDGSLAWANTIQRSTHLWHGSFDLVIGRAWPRSGFLHLTAWLTS